MITVGLHDKLASVSGRLLIYAAAAFVIGIRARRVELAVGEPVSSTAE
jgi:hypothetical protein